MKRWAMLLLVGCATVKSDGPFPELARQIIVPMMGREKLVSTRTVCEKECSMEVREHDLANENIRWILNESKFICQAAGRKIYTICMDKAGLCTYDKFCANTFLGICTRWEESREFIAESETETLLGLGIMCFSPLVYPMLVNSR